MRRIEFFAIGVLIGIAVSLGCGADAAREAARQDRSASASPASESPASESPASESPASESPASAKAESPARSGTLATLPSVNSDAASAEPRSAEAVWFEEVGAAAGVRFRHVSGNSPQKPFPAANGSGLATFDFDRDGRYDLFFCIGTAFPLAEPSQRSRCQLYRNAIVDRSPAGQVGDWRFDEISRSARADVEGFCAGVAAGDYDNDGFTDLYITRFGPNILLRNQGDGTFQRVELEAGVADPRWGASAAFFDADEDGDLDLYVCNYAQWTWENNPYCGDKTRGIRMHCGPKAIAGERDVFYQNQGDSTFREQLDESGMGGVAYRGQGVVAGDLNDDGHVDLYVGNDLQPNLVFMGDGRGKFRDATETSGAAYDANGAAQASMGVDMADITGDGLPELFTTNFHLEYNAFYENLGRSLFIDASARFGLVADSLVHVGWGTQFADFDLDGQLDLIVVNGHVDDNRHEIGENSPYAQPVLLYRFDGRRFARVANREAGRFLEIPHCGRGLAVSDLDNDGDPDVVFQRQDERPALLRNLAIERAYAPVAAERSPDPKSVNQPPPFSLRLRLIGTKSNRDAVGASVTVRGPSGSVSRQVRGGGSYLSAPDPRIQVSATHASDLVVVRWPSGSRSEHTTPKGGTMADLIIVEPMDGD
jgi:hypothetical protein